MLLMIVNESWRLFFVARFSFDDIRRIRVHEAISSKIVFDAGLLNRR